MEVMLILRYTFLEVAAPPKGLFSTHWLHKLALCYVNRISLSNILKLGHVWTGNDGVFFQILIHDFLKQTLREKRRLFSQVIFVSYLSNRAGQPTSVKSQMQTTVKEYSSLIKDMHSNRKQALTKAIKSDSFHFCFCSFFLESLVNQPEAVWL